jgi:hypothetical protein
LPTPISGRSTFHAGRISVRDSGKYTNSVVTARSVRKSAVAAQLWTCAAPTAEPTGVGSTVTCAPMYPAAARIARAAVMRTPAGEKPPSGRGSIVLETLISSPRRVTFARSSAPKRSMPPICCW